MAKAIMSPFASTPALRRPEMVEVMAPCDMQAGTTNKVQSTVRCAFPSSVADWRKSHSSEFLVACLLCPLFLLGFCFMASHDGLTFPVQVVRVCVECSAFLSGHLLS
jgi:hypothetical protein